LQIPHSDLLDRASEECWTTTAARDTLVVRGGCCVCRGVSRSCRLSRYNRLLDLYGRPGVLVISERHTHLLRRVELDQGIFFLGVLAALHLQVLRRYVVIAILDYLISIQEGVLGFRVEEVN